MLVLSRKEAQKFSFPDIGITVQVLRVNSSSVRLGIEAPLEVRILRDEVDSSSKSQSRPHVVVLPAEMRHELRNELNAISLGVQLFKEELKAGFHDDAEVTFRKLVGRLEKLCGNSLLSKQGGKMEANGLTALVVDDEPNEREMLAGFLRIHGYQVATASDGEEAIAYLESEKKPSVVLMDMRMPRCDGASTIRRIRSDHSNDGIKIFAISGSTPEENDLDSREDRINQWFMKPPNPKLLVEAMLAGQQTN